VARFIFLLCALLSFGAKVFSQTTTFSGVDSLYAGKKLQFITITNGIVNTESVVAEVVCDNNGAFNCNVNIDQPKEVFFRVGQLEVYFTASPNKDYKLLLPPVIEISDQDRFNPFFKYKRMFARFINPDNYLLNNIVNKFDHRFLQVYAECTLALKEHQPLSAISRKIDNLNNEFEGYNYKYFTLLKLSKITLLKYKFKCDNYKKNTLAVLKLYNEGVKNIGYSELLNCYIDNILNSSVSKLNKEIRYSFWNKESVSKLLTIANKEFECDFLSEIFLVKAIAYYSVYDELDFIYLVNLLLELKQISKVEINSQICDEEYSYLTYLHKGFDVPNLILKDKKGKTVNIDDYKGKYVLVGFCTTYGTSVYNELKSLRNFYGKFTRNLNVVLVFNQEDKDFIPSWDDTIHERWDILFSDKDKKIISDFKVKVFPTFYLIDREGKMLLSPTPFMSEGFESAMYNILRTEKRVK